MKTGLRSLTAGLLMLVLLPTITRAGVVEGFGVFTGANSAMAVFEYRDFETTGHRRRAGFQIGVHMEWFGIGVFRLCTEFEYVQKGMVEEVTITGENGPEPMGTMRISNRADYLSLPVHLKTRFPMGKNALYAVAGPRIDFKIGHAIRYSNSVFEEFVRTAYGGDVGIGYEIGSFAPVLVRLELRYSMDFSDAYRTDLLTVRNNALEILAGIGL